MQYIILPAKKREAPLVEAALKNAGIAYCHTTINANCPRFSTSTVPEQALHNAGFYIWGDRFTIRCRIRAVLRRGLKV